MKYQNTRTGAVIEAVCPISGGNWQPVPEEGTGEAPEEKAEKKPRRKAAAKPSAD